MRDYATTTQVLEKVNLEAQRATNEARMHRRNPIINDKVGIAFMHNSLRSTSRAVKRLSSASSKDYFSKSQTSQSSGVLVSDNIGRVDSVDSCDLSCSASTLAENSNNNNDSGDHYDSGRQRFTQHVKVIDSPIHNFLRAHHPSSSFYDLYGIESSTMHTYVNTAAGSCVMTYILGDAYSIFRYYCFWGAADCAFAFRHWRSPPRQYFAPSFWPALPCRLWI